MTSSNPVLVNARFNQGFQSENHAIELQEAPSTTINNKDSEPIAKRNGPNGELNPDNSIVDAGRNLEEHGKTVSVSTTRVKDEESDIKDKIEPTKDSAVKPDNGEVKLDAQVKTDNLVNTEISVKIDNEVKTDGGLKRDSSVKIDDGDESDFEEDTNSPSNFCASGTDKISSGISGFIKNHNTSLRFLLVVILLCGYIAYFVFAIIHSIQLAIPLIVLTGLAVLIFALYGVGRLYGRDINARCCQPLVGCCGKRWRYLQWVVYLALLAAFVIFVVIDVRKDPYRLTSLSGIAILLLLSFVFSKHPSRVRWRPVIWGVILQMIFGLLVLRWSVGLTAVNWFSDQVIAFLAYTDAGSAFVFGDYSQHPFAFQSLPVVIFFSAVIGILYHWGIMQKVIKLMAVALQVTMGTTALETLATASNIFVSYVEVAPILIPYIHRLTKSELHAILTSGFATVAGSILAIYISFGAPTVHLISACIVSAPAALAVAKLSYPETKISKTKTQRDVQLPRSKQRNFVEAAAAGAMIAVKLIGGIIACLIAFLGIVAFIDAVLAWLGSRVGINDPPLSFAMMCSYIFWPLTVMMGVEPADAKRVASMLGLKIFVDDVLCYADLGDAVSQGAISNRSAVIATYACCGFGSLGALGVALGTMYAIAPKRKKAISDIIIRALINGNIAAFMTACVAGFLYPGASISSIPPTAAVNTTMSATTALV